MKKEYLLTGFKIELHPCGSCISVRAFFDNNVGNPLLGNYDSDVSLPWERFVYPPNIIERLMGKTYEDKLKNAKNQVAVSAKKRIEKHNKSARAINNLLPHERCP